MNIQVNIAAAILAEVVERLAQAAGLDPDVLEPKRIGWTIEARRRKLGQRDPAEYLEYLKSSSEELDHLVDALVIHETRFFRDPAAFEQIRKWAEGAVANGQSSFRILSAPCSTGPEAYSVAAILRQAGVPLCNFTIDAFDISRAALMAAERGAYQAGALEHVPGELRQFCGDLSNGQWRIHDDVRARIRFERRNLAISGALGDEPLYNLILCRNLFIYLHPQARTVLADSLHRVLLPEARLIIGTGDRVPELNSRFAPLKPAASFAFVHKPPVKVHHAPEVPAVPTRAYIHPLTTSRHAPAHDRPPASAADFYERALEYNQCGNLRQAERRCRQALYLDPCHVPAMELLDALWHLHPSTRLRRALQARISRIRISEGDGARLGKDMA